MRVFAAEHLVADLALRILHHDAALGALHEHDERDDADAQDEESDDEPGRHGAGAAELQKRGERVRQVGDDAGEDDQRDAVADAARRDLLAEPHQEHGAAGQRRPSW